MQQEPKIKINPDNTIIVTVSNGTAYTLREPLAKDMAGLGQDLIKIKHTETIQKLLSKISTPKIGMAQYGGFSMADAQALNAAVDFFSAPPSAKVEIREAFAELGYIQDSATEQTLSAD
ncbi:hypothetical protein HMPREF2753_09175 [Neisseria sp. HMSC071C03]|nr:hypothetical protein HMPREF3054_10135 [Neisseria sp. HMSC071B12]OHR51440.1 hypothetical protein HMPREF2753_09175 [Neisseria sp. HMSC071C03]